MIEAPSGFLADYLDYTDSFHYPRHWNLACGMVLVGLASAESHLMHRAWPVRPLIHPIFIGDSGTGKGACCALLKRVKKAAMPNLTTVGDEATSKGILVKLRKKGFPACIVAEELTTMINRMDFQKNIVPILTRLADNNDYNKDLAGEEFDFPEVRISIVLGTNEEALREHFTAKIIKQGLASRFIWMYSEMTDEPENGPNDNDPDVARKFARAVESLVTIRKAAPSKLILTSEAHEWYRAWHVNFRNHRPADRALSGYYSRRHLAVLRSGLISALSRSAKEVTDADLEWGWAWVQSCEDQMFRIFENMDKSSWGQCEGTLTDYLKGKDWVRESELTRKFGSRWSGASSVRRVLDSLTDSRIITREETKKGGGRRYTLFAIGGPSVSNGQRGEADSGE